MASKSTIYSALDPQKRQIRLLHLKPGSLDDKVIQCSTQIVSLDAENLEYEALSYVWGDRSNDQIVQLDGMSRKVTANLFEALINVCKVASERIMWIDALCIDQDNDEERSEQVPKMHDIYSRALRVIIYLGPSWPGIELAWRYFEVTCYDSNIHLDPGLEHNIGANSLDIKDNDLLQSISNLVTHPWWTRIWTAQEYHLSRASTIQCGQTTINADIVFQSAYHTRHHTTSCCHSLDHPRSPCRPLFYLECVAEMAVRRHRAKNNISDDPEDFLTLLGDFRSRQATDPRDKIYGILGLAYNTETYIDTVDYTVTCERLYTDLALSTIKHNRSLDILCFVQPNVNLRSLPSWVPDWSALGTGALSTGIVTRREFTLPKLYNACNNRPIIYTVENNKLRVMGHIIDTIDLTMFSEYLQCVQYPPSHWLDAHWSSFVDGRVFSNDNSLARKTEFWLTMCGGLIMDLDGDLRKRVTILDYTPFEKWKACMSSSNSKVPDLEVTYVDYCVGLTSIGRMLALTKHDRIAWVPGDARSGDVVALLTGSRTPIILRPCAEGYTVLGDAYVHNLMDGKAMPDDELLEEITLV